MVLGKDGARRIQGPPVMLPSLGWKRFQSTEHPGIHSRHKVLTWVLMVVVSIGALACSFGRYPGLRVNTITPRTSSGERVVRVETLLRQSPERVWKAFSTEEGLRCWIAPVVNLDLRTGGVLLTNYDRAGAIGGPGTISLDILNYVENEEITFKVKLNDKFPERLQREDGHLQEIVELQRQQDGGTKVVSSMVGWGNGQEWDRAFEFFARGNEWSYKNLAKCFAD
jgi:uncharacterized protein YndB with AHSA1/START domain